MDSRLRGNDDIIEFCRADYGHPGGRGRNQEPWPARRRPLAAHRTPEDWEAKAHQPQQGAPNHTLPTPHPDRTNCPTQHNPDIKRKTALISHALRYDTLSHTGPRLELLGMLTPATLPTAKPKRAQLFHVKQISHL